MNESTDPTERYWEYTNEEYAKIVQSIWEKPPSPVYKCHDPNSPDGRAECEFYHFPKDDNTKTNI